VQQLAAIREQWGDLLAAIERPPAAEWPPRETRAFLDLGAADAERTDRPAVGRLPLTLREHPAPLNLDALDAACEIEAALFDLADRLAAAHQSITADRDSADRWHYAGLRHLDRRAPVSSAGSRANGLHWAACWIEDRLSATEPTELHGVVRGVLREHAEQVIAAAHRAMTRALGRDGRTTVLPAPCPWCHGELTARTTSGDPMAATVTCGTGPTCTAPAPYDGDARRVWRGADLCGLYGAMSAANRRATA
jgi:hypothetical protein